MIRDYSIPFSLTMLAKWTRFLWGKGKILLFHFLLIWTLWLQGSKAGFAWIRYTHLNSQLSIHKLCYHDTCLYTLSSNKLLYHINKSLVTVNQNLKWSVCNLFVLWEVLIICKLKQPFRQLNLVVITYCTIVSHYCRLMLLSKSKTGIFFFSTVQQLGRGVFRCVFCF